MLKSLNEQVLTHAPTHAHMPHVLQRVALGIMAFLTLMSFTLANIQSLLWIKSDWLVSTILPAVIVELTNEERGEDAEAALVRNSVLDAAATRKAEHMALNGYFAHYSPDGVSPWHWFDEAGYSFRHAGENLAVHFTDSENVVDAWMDSPGHRANILNENFTEIGVGTAKGTYKGYSTVFVVQLFGTPAAGTQQAVAATVPLLGPTGLEETFALEGGVGEEVAAAEATAGSMEEQVVLTSDLATTSRDGIAAPVTKVGWFGHVATQPGSWLQIMYGVLSLFVVALLGISMVLEWKRHEPLQMVYSTGLLFIMALLFVAHTLVTNGATIL